MVIALSTNTRIIGFILVLATCFYLVFATITKKISGKEFFINSLLLVGINIFLWYLFLPASWGNPISFLLRTLGHFSKYDLVGKELYMGKLELSTNLPWHYLPVWIFISTPIFYMILFFLGIAFLIKGFFSNKNTEKIFDYIVLGIFIISLLLPICLHSTLYNGWRHFYFLYVPFLYLAVLGLSALLSIKNKIIKPIVLGISVGSLIFNGTWMIKNHPYQMIYFNILVREKAPYKFEKDYWGVSSSECLRFIVSQSNDLRIEVGDYDAVLYSTKFSLKKSDRERIVDEPFGYDASRMKYLVLNYTKVIGNEKKILFYEPVYKIKVDGINVATVFERKDKDGIWANAIVKNITSNINSELTTLIFDKDDQTGWSTKRIQKEGDYLLLELKEAMQLYGISILTGTGKYEYPQELQIEGSENGIDWKILPLNYKTQSDYAFSPAKVRFIKLILKQDSEENAWTVNDMIFHIFKSE